MTHIGESVNLSLERGSEVKCMPTIKLNQIMTGVSHHYNLYDPKQRGRESSSIQTVTDESSVRALDQSEIKLELIQYPEKRQVCAAFIFIIITSTE